MKSKIENYFKGIIVVALIAFALCCVITKADTFPKFISCGGYAVSITTFIAVLYINFAWRWNPLEKVPRLEKTYIGTLKYCYDGESGEKPIIIKIKQNLFSIKVNAITNEISSKTVSSDIVKENGYYFLYYTYETNPKSEFSDKNPMQIGACKFDINNPNELTGKYWTNRKTIGDIVVTPEFNKCEESK